MDQQGHVIGIDLGTTNSVVAVMEGGELRVIPTPEGLQKTPSVVLMQPDGSVIVGELARRQAATQPGRAITSAKRLLGRLLSEIEENEESYPFELGEHADGRVVIQIEDQDYLPEAFSAHVLAKLKAAAEDYLGGPVARAVVTVPAYFDDLQRQATLEAARMAGLEVLRLLNEPTAAAMAYGLGRDEGHHVVAVYDFGGGTFDFSLLEIDHKTFEVLISTGDSRLGGDDIDNLLVDHLAEQFLAEQGFDLRDDLMALRRLKDAAEQAKCELSTAAEARISLPFIAYKDGAPLHMDYALSRDLVEELAEPLVQRTLACCTKALREAKLKKEQVNRVILVGGSTRMPLVQDLVEDFFELPPFKGVNPDEVVALGAAAQGAVMNGELEEVVLLDVTPHCLGIEIKGGRKSTIVEKNSTIPIKVFKTFTTTEDNQAFVQVHVLQGESEKAADCRSVGKFTLSGLTSAAAGVPRIRVTFFINADGIVDISAGDLQSGAEKSLTINHAYLSAAERRQSGRSDSRRRRRKRRDKTGTGPSHTQASDLTGSRGAATGGSTNHATRAHASRHPAHTGATPAHELAPAAFAQSAAAVAEATPVPMSVSENSMTGGFAEIKGDTEGGKLVARHAAEADTLPAGPARARHNAPDPADVAPMPPRGVLPNNSIPSAGAQYAETILRETPTPNAPPPTYIGNGGQATIFPPDLAPVLQKLSQNIGDPQACQEYESVRDELLRYCGQQSANAALQLLLARFHIFSRQPGDAHDVLNRLSQTHPELADQIFELYGQLCHEFPEYLAARKEHARAAATLGDYPLAMRELEQMIEDKLEDEELVEELRNVYQQALAERQDATVQFKLVKLHLRRRELDSAISLLQSLVAQPEYRDRANKILGLCFWQKGMRYLAWQKFRALPLDDEMKDILYRLSEDMEKYDELLHAKYALERVYEIDINFRDVGDRLRKLGFRLELQKDDRYGSPFQAHSSPMRTPWNDVGGEIARRFEILGEINRGSMGIVYKARDLVLDEIVALKVLNDFLCSDPQAVERFKKEARSARKLTHQNIVRIHDMYELSDKKLISMEYIEGENLKTILAREQVLPEDRILNYLIQICEALAYAHRLQLVHRDIKPANIMITERNLLKVTDFGIAKLMSEQQTKAATMVMGTPLYMAPEQIEGGKIDNRCDIYSLGIMLYEMATGNPPFYEGNIEYQHIHAPAPEITAPVSERLRRIIARCIEKQPDNRFHSIEEIMARII